jgi:hypothetical protein
MDTDLEKDKLLRSAGFRYHFDRMAYVNAEAKKVVSIEFLEDNNEDELKQLISEASDPDAWRFYFTERPSAAVVHAFLAELG